jgi:hypothetical protein
LLYEDDDGNLRILMPSLEYQQPRETEEEALSRLAAGLLPSVAEFLVCRPENIPTDLTFRKAWKKGDPHEPVKIDLDLCLEIHRERLSLASARKIALLNHELELALERDDLPTQVAIRKTKQILRNIHEMNLTHCKTPEDVKHCIPRELREVWDFYNPAKEQSNEPVTPSSFSSNDSPGSRGSSNS